VLAEAGECAEAGTGFDIEDLNETGEILGILFNASGYCSPCVVGVAHEAGVRRGIAGVRSAAAASGVEHADCSPRAL